MGKKKAQKKQSSKGVKTELEKPLEGPKPFDFGGIPDRDLKKNLGCG